jgi:HAD superfamily phosphoserine phosphatase-like hydrolase
LTLASATKASHFVESILSLQPKVAAFDCDGTLWWRDAGERFFDWELEQRLVSDAIAKWARPRYAEYKAGKVAEEVMCGEMVTMHRGLTATEVQAAAVRFFDQYFADNIIPEMRELVRRLREAGCDIWAVSSTNEWVIQAAMRHFGILDNRILAAAVEVEEGKITDRLIRVPSGPGKPQVIRGAIGREPDAAFGNSIWDREMLELAKYPVAVNPNRDLLEIAQKNGWKIYCPEPRS